MSVKKELVSGVFYISVAKYAGIFISLAVSGVLGRLFGPEQFGVVAIATIIIAFFAIFSDLGIGPAIIQHKNLEKRDIESIFSLTVWSGAILSLLFFAAAPLVARFYDESEMLPAICRILSINLFFAAVNIVPNSLILKEKRFRFVAIRSLCIQLVGGTAAITAAYSGTGIYALLINPIFSSIALFVVNYRENPLRLHVRIAKDSVMKVFSFSVYQFGFQLINYFSRNVDKLLMGKGMSISDLGYYEKSYRLMMLPLQNIAYVVSPVMHPIFSEMQNDLQKLAASYLRVVRLLSLIGFPLSVVIYFTSRELMLLIFGPQWEPSIPVLQILSLSVGIQIVMSTSGSIFQAANATRMLFVCGVFSATLNVASICLGIFGFGTMEAVAWCICTSFLVNFVQCYYALFRQTLHAGWGLFWRGFMHPMLLTGILVAALGGLQFVLPAQTPMLLSLAAKAIVALLLWVGFVQLSGELDLKNFVFHKLLKRTS